MSGEYDDELLPITPADLNVPCVFAPGAATKSPFQDMFPPAHEGVGQIGTAGEYRGIYGSANNWLWRPEWSRYKEMRPTGKLHWAIDLYAPVGTPLVAVVDGSLDFSEQAGGLGTYARLTFEKNGGSYSFHYGHMRAKNGAPRSVTKGELVGWVGCTGNADVGKVCSTLVSGKDFSSSHLHFALLPPQDANHPKRCDPIGTLNWTVVLPQKPSGL